MAVIWGKGEWQGLESEKLMVVEFTPVCSPDLLKGGPPLKSPADLVHFPLLYFGGAWYCTLRSRDRARVFGYRTADPSL